MGKQWKQCQTLFSWAPKSQKMVTAAMKLKDTCSLEGNLDSILKSRDFALLTKAHTVKAMVFPVVTYGCESWTIKKAELQRIDAFKLWCWRRLLRVPWTARRSNQSILKEVNAEYSLEELMLKLKLQHFGCLMQTADSLEKTLLLGKMEGRRRRRRQRIRCPSTQWTWVWADSRRECRTGKPDVLQPMGSQRLGHDLVIEQQEVHTLISCSSLVKENTLQIDGPWKRIFQNQCDNHMQKPANVHTALPSC